MNEPVMDYMQRYRFKKLLLLDDADTGLRAVIAIHSTALGPAGGGVRFWPYPSEKEAMVDAMRVALQGLGAVGYRALRLLVESGARVVVADVDGAKVRQAQQEFGVEAVPAEDIYEQDVDIYGPYALGAVINDQTIPRIKARIVAGSANNVLAEERHGTQLEERGICYAVDFVANSGGIVYDEEVVYSGLREPQGDLRHDRAEKKVREIFGRIEEVFAIADREGVPCWRAAELLAERRIEAINRVRLLNTGGQVHHR